MSNLPVIAKTKELVEVAAKMEMNIGTTGAILVFGMLISKGLLEVANAIKSAGRATGAIGKVADAIRDKK